MGKNCLALGLGPGCGYATQDGPRRPNINGFLGLITPISDVISQLIAVMLVGAHLAPDKFP